MNAIVHFATLQELSKRTRPTAVRRWLTKSRIHFKLNADGQPFTTLAIIEEAVQRYIEQQRWQIGEIRKAIAEADRGEFASDDEVETMFAKLTGRR